jgi:hypothetical protein
MRRTSRIRCIRQHTVALERNRHEKFAFCQMRTFFKGSETA